MATPLSQGPLQGLIRVGSWKGWYLLSVGSTKRMETIRLQGGEWAFPMRLSSSAIGGPASGFCNLTAPSLRDSDRHLHW